MKPLTHAARTASVVLVMSLASMLVDAARGRTGEATNGVASSAEAADFVVERK